jgi:hypothetical protein
MQGGLSAGLMPCGQICSALASTASLRIAERPPHPRSLRSLHLSPRAGRGKKRNRSRDACAPESCRYDAQEAKPDPVMRRRRWGRLPPDHVQPLVEHDLFGKPDATFPDHARIKQDGETPIDACSFRPHPSGCGRALSAARSPVGVPPRHLRQRTNATAQLQNVLPGT